MWSVGCILGELSDGQPLFPGESEIDQVGDPQVAMKQVRQKNNQQQHLIVLSSLSNENGMYLQLSFDSYFNSAVNPCDETHSHSFLDSTPEQDRCACLIVRIRQNKQLEDNMVGSWSWQSAFVLIV